MSEVHPRPFEYIRPETVADAVAALAGAGGEVRAIAGGQSLVPMMTLGLALPDVLVDIGRLPLAGAERRNGTLALGALTRHRELERSAELAAEVPLASEAARYIGNPRVRNRGTLGGSLSHADPAAELGAVALTYGGRAVIAGADGERRRRSPPAEELCAGGRLGGELLPRLAAAVAEGVSPEDDAFISGAYRARAAGTCAARAVETAWKRALGE